MVKLGIILLTLAPCVAQAQWPDREERWPLRPTRPRFDRYQAEPYRQSGSEPAIRYRYRSDPWVGYRFDDPPPTTLGNGGPYPYTPEYER